MTPIEKKSLLFVTTRLGGGGAERHLVRIANSLASRYQVHIAVLRARGSYEAFVKREILIHHVSPRWTHRSTVLSAHTGNRRLAKLVSQLQPVCLVSFLEPSFYTSHLALRRQTDHTPHLVAIQNNLGQSLKRLSGFMKQRLLSGVIDAIQSADGIIAISAGVAGDVVERFPESWSKIRTIYNSAFEGVPPSRDQAAESVLPRRKSKFQIVACGRLTEQKGFCDLLTALKSVREKLDVSLWILGTGPLQSDLINQARELGLGDSVEFLGFQPDPLPFFAASDLFVLSSWWEGFGNVIVEAMSVGTPVVATDCHYGPAEIIQHGVNGILLPPRSPKQLAYKITAALEDSQLRARLGENGKTRSSDFRAETIANEYARFINEQIK